MTVRRELKRSSGSLRCLRINYLHCIAIRIILTAMAFQFVMTHYLVCNEDDVR